MGDYCAFLSQFFFGLGLVVIRHDGCQVLRRR